MLVNNAGITRDKPLALMQEDDWRAVIRNQPVRDHPLCARRGVWFMKQKRGRIVNITSVSGQTGLPGQTNYAASKAGIIGFTRALAKRWRNTDDGQCRVPGYIDTDMLATVSAQEEQMLAKIPMGRIGQPHGNG